MDFTSSAVEIQSSSVSLYYVTCRDCRSGLAVRYKWFIPADVFVRTTFAVCVVERCIVSFVRLHVQSPVNCKFGFFSPPFFGSFLVVINSVFAALLCCVVFNPLLLVNAPTRDHANVVLLLVNWLLVGHI